MFPTARAFFLAAVLCAAAPFTTTACDGGSDPVDTTDTPDKVFVADSDGDGLSDALENLLGTKPNAVDSDNDGLADKVEIAAGDPLAYDIGIDTDPTVDDTDGDTVCDGDEIEHGTDPVDSESYNPDAIHTDPVVDNPPEITQADLDASCVPHAWMTNEWSCQGFHDDPFEIRTEGRKLDGKAVCHVQSDVIFLEWTSIQEIDELDETKGTLTHNISPSPDYEDYVNCEIQD